MQVREVGMRFQCISSGGGGEGVGLGCSVHEQQLSKNNHPGL